MAGAKKAKGKKARSAQPAPPAQPAPSVPTTNAHDASQAAGASSAPSALTPARPKLHAYVDEVGLQRVGGDFFVSQFKLKNQLLVARLLLSLMKENVMVVPETAKCVSCRDEALPCVVEGHQYCTGCDTSSKSKRSTCRFTRSAKDQVAEKIVDDLLKKSEKSRAKERRVARLELKAFESTRKDWIDKIVPDCPDAWIGPEVEDEDDTDGEEADGVQEGQDAQDNEEEAGTSQDHHASTSGNVPDSDDGSAAEGSSGQGDDSGGPPPDVGADDNEGGEPEKKEVEENQLGDDEDDELVDEQVVYVPLEAEEDELANDDVQVKSEPVEPGDDDEPGSPAQTAPTNDEDDDDFVFDFRCLGNRFDRALQHDEVGYVVAPDPSQMGYSFELGTGMAQLLVPPRAVAVLDRVEVITASIVALLHGKRPTANSIEVPRFMYRVRVPCTHCNDQGDDCVVAKVPIADGHLDLEWMRCLSCRNHRVRCSWFDLEGRDDMVAITRVVDFE
ncbi:uncharacterized protein LOC62_07G009486 [Vanrija pseudolonga]|uniref:Uncharacterized protein n=1 Tax=Vanrija pseudolonga TaxID=143232 RepID=A0AAF0YG57_9TREE|nr:hypothetical protein LOC62_07G009486 [Vanrija pseudolonga]